jgi:predicted metal-dependent HD superfamily phosphohydrolase
MLEKMRRAWIDLLDVWSVDPSQANENFEEISRRYVEPGRYYHTLAHIHDVLETVECLGADAKNLNAVRLAAWLHDVIYDSKASDNEERSGEYAERLCTRFRIPHGGLVDSLILATKTHAPGEDTDAQVLVDSDLAILGADEAPYQSYSGQIRKEYAWVPEPEYVKGRRLVLESFLSKPRIYSLLIDLEEPARRNIAAEISELSSIP